MRAIITSERNGPVLGAVSVGDDDGLLMMSLGGQAVRICVGDTRVMGRATQGVRLVNMKNGDVLVGMQKVESRDIPEEDKLEKSEEEKDELKDPLVKENDDASYS